MSSYTQIIVFGFLLAACAGVDKSSETDSQTSADIEQTDSDIVSAAEDVGSDESSDAAEEGDDATSGTDAEPGADAIGEVGELPSPEEILEAFGFKGVEGADEATVAGYAQTFGFLDKDGDGIVTLDEYIASGHFGEEQATLIFNATDRNQDGEVTEQEYVENRIITDEAKLIFYDLDTNDDEDLVETEFVENAPFTPEVSAGVYGLLDINGDGSVNIPEYLRVWGAWARGEEPPADGEGFPGGPPS